MYTGTPMRADRVIDVYLPDTLNIYEFPEAQGKRALIAINIESTLYSIYLS